MGKHEAPRERHVGRALGHLALLFIALVVMFAVCGAVLGLVLWWMAKAITG